MDLQQELLALIPDPARVSSGESILAAHGQDYSYHAPHPPQVVVFATSRDEVGMVLRFAQAKGVPVVACGARTSLEGHIIPMRGGISLDLSLMNRVLEVRPDDMLVRAQAGVTRMQLTRALRPHGLQFPLDPGADATLGGMAATNASGTTAVQFGVMRDQVLDLEVVLLDGSVIRTGGMAAKSSAGYNLTGLFIGSEGTLGVITEVTVRVRALPEASISVRATFADVVGACEAARALLSSGAGVARVELVDEHTVRAVNAAKGTAYHESPTLFLEFSGGRESVEADVRIAEEVCQDAAATDFAVERETEARNRLWEARHEAALAVMQTAPGKKQKVTDVCVPRSALPQAIREARATIDRYGVYGAILGHVGDGNYHVIFMVDPADVHEVELAEAINDEIVSYALAHGGTCTGEHGVGIGKMNYLAREHGDTVPWMRAIKRVFDPDGLLNPDKLF